MAGIAQVASHVGIPAVGRRGTPSFTHPPMTTTPIAPPRLRSCAGWADVAVYHSSADDTAEVEAWLRGEGLVSGCGACGSPRGWVGCDCRRKASAAPGTFV